MNALRWWLFKKACPLVWRLCPEPHRTDLFSSMSFDKDIWSGKVVRE